MSPAARRVLGFVLLGAVCFCIAGFAALYTYAYSLVPHPTAAPEVAQSRDPHRTEDLFSRADLARVMPQMPSGVKAASEPYEANAYRLDACPTLTRTYRFASGKRGACAAIVAVVAAYASEGLCARPASSAALSRRITEERRRVPFRGCDHLSYLVCERYEPDISNADRSNERILVETFPRSAHE